MKLLWTDEADVRHFTLLLMFRSEYCHIFFCLEITVFGGMVTLKLSGGVVNTGHV